MAGALKRAGEHKRARGLRGPPDLKRAEEAWPAGDRCGSPAPARGGESRTHVRRATASAPSSHPMLLMSSMTWEAARLKSAAKAKWPTAGCLAKASWRSVNGTRKAWVAAAAAVVLVLLMVQVLVLGLPLTGGG